MAKIAPQLVDKRNKKPAKASHTRLMSQKGTSRLVTIAYNVETLPNDAARRLDW